MLGVSSPKICFDNVPVKIYDYGIIMRKVTLLSVNINVGKKFDQLLQKSVA